MTGQHPRLRSHTRRRKSGRMVTYYVYDMRPEGRPDIALGRDFGEALKQWDEIHNRAPRIAGTLTEAMDDWERKELPKHKEVTRQGYARHLRKLRPAFGGATWDGVSLKDLIDYLDKRNGKTQANREVSLLGSIWNWARIREYTDLPWPAAGLQKSAWKNPEGPRAFQPRRDEFMALFQAVYDQADQTLRDCMDLASATGMRLTDCRTIPLPPGDMLRLKASKTGKEADFDLQLSAVLPDLLARRRASKALHLKLLSTPTGREVTYSMLRGRWDDARNKAAKKAAADGQDEFAARIRLMYLRDMRKLASRLAGEGATDLLQHGDRRTTELHYPSAVRVLKPTR